MNLDVFFAVPFSIDFTFFAGDSSDSQNRCHKGLIIHKIQLLTNYIHNLNITMKEKNKGDNFGLQNFAKDEQVFRRKKKTVRKLQRLSFLAI